MPNAARRRSPRPARSRPLARRATSRNPGASKVEGTLQELEARQRKSVPLQVKIAQAGLTWSKRQFFLISAAMGIGAFLLFLVIDAGLWAALAMAFAAGLGMPLWLLKFLKKRRETKFLNAFPDAVDTIVRGIKAGLPLLDSMRIIALESPEPVRSEFRSIMETQAVGMPIGEACQKLFERIPVPEANFFGIVIASNRRPAATSRKRSATSRACCATARR
jgi:tight adherence protein B